MIGREQIIMAYEHFYSIKYGNEKYKFKPSDKANQKIDEFIKLLDKEYKLVSIGPMFLSRYFSFHFNRLEGQTFKRFMSKAGVAGKIQIYDIIGKKAVELFESRNTKFDYTLSLHTFELELEESPPRLNKAEEIQKKLFHNTTTGLRHCLEKTSLFNHKSSLCITCKEQDTCKELLHLNYPKIYSDRQYGSTT